jgi:PAS domain S-box-containing protein
MSAPGPDIKDLHHLLRQQIERHFGGLGAVPPEYLDFIRTIDGAYRENDRERKETQQALKEGERFLSNIFSGIEDGVTVLDREMTILGANPTMEEWYGHALPLTGKKCFEAYYGADEMCQLCPSEFTLRTGKTGWAQMERKGAGGEVTGWLEVYSFPLTDTVTGTMKGVIELARDVTERRQAEQALKRSENLYRAIFENTGTAAVVIDEGGHITLANSGFEKLSGYTREELENKKKWSDFVAGNGLPRASEAAISRVLEEGAPLTPLSYECDMAGREGVVRSCINNVCRIPGSRKVVASMLDITDMKRLQGQLIHAQKMEALGTLAGGIAHDFNNLLMSIQGYASLVLHEVGDRSPYADKLRGIEEHVRSGADLTRQLLGCAQGGTYEVKPISLNDVVERTATMFGRTKKEIIVHKNFQGDLWTVEADQGEIERVFLNLFLNAWQAMPGGGGLYLDTANVTLDKKYVEPHHVPPGPYVRVSTTDTGIGMDEKTKSRIFEPFFTTRETGRGTGLGLASAYGIIKAHGGIITVYSEKGRGSTFTIYLPASDKEKVEEKGSSDRLLGGSETVLLVDDEPSILAIAREVLELLGYTVLTAGSGREAVDIFREQKGRIDLVILDMIMPQMSGGDTFDLLKNIDPEVRVLLSSGYSITGEANRIVDRGCRGFIQKPFTPGELSQKIREALASPDPSA